MLGVCQYNAKAHKLLLTFYLQNDNRKNGKGKKKTRGEINKNGFASMWSKSNGGGMGWNLL